MVVVQMDTAIAHKHFPGVGGAERVALVLADEFDAPIYTGYESDGVETDADVRELFGDGLSGRLLQWNTKLGHVFRFFYYMTHWDCPPELSEYDTIIQSGYQPMWYVPEDDQTVVNYIHSPPRLPYDLLRKYQGSQLHRLWAHLLRQLLATNTSYPVFVVANSEIVARRCRRYMGIPSDRIRVVYPPIDVASYDRSNDAVEDDRIDDRFYFTVSRLDSNKRIGTIVEAFNRLDRQLVIGGSGPARERLESIADDDVVFLGRVSEERKRRLCAAAEAGVFAARNEDFGIVPIEFFAAGTPVLGVHEGYTKHQILDGKNGVTFDCGVDDLVACVERFERDGVDWDPKRIEEFAERFSTEKFRSRMQSVVEEARERNDTTPAWRAELTEADRR